MERKQRQLTGYPTAARLVAALLLAGVGVAMYFLLLQLYPDGEDRAFRLERNQVPFLSLFAGVGLFVGWRNLGVRASGYDGSGVSLGLQAVIIMTLWIVIGLSLRYGTVKMLANAYGSNTVAAILDMIQQGMFYLSFALDPIVLGAAAVAGGVSGILTVTAAKHWR